MKELRELEQAVAGALAFLRSQPDIKSAQVYASANNRLWARLDYTSHIPCNGVEEPKSIDDYGIGVHIVLDSPDGQKTGFGSEERDLSLEGVKLALYKAKEGAILDPEFRCLPQPTGEKRTLFDYHDPMVMGIADRGLVEGGWKILDGAMSSFAGSERLRGMAPGGALAQLGLIVGGDLSIVQERMAVGSYDMPDVQGDESAAILTYVTSMVEKGDAKGSGYSVHLRLADLDDRAGSEAAANAIDSLGGIRVPSGDYPVILGPQPVGELMSHLVIPSCTTGAFYARQSCFLGKLGKQVASDKLTIIDRGNVAGLIASKGITCEGLPTGETVLIKEGVLSGLLSEWYEYQRILNDPQAREKLGVSPTDVREALTPRNGFRFGREGGRNFGVTADASATNVVFESRARASFADLVREIKKGILVGRLWYTYPINGLAAGDFTSTLTAESYFIEDGQVKAPIKVNTLRINDNIANILTGITGMTGEARPTVLWGGGDQIVYAPVGLMVDKVHFEAIAEFMDQTY
ncbi:MAG: TldD/PmbA family protein [Dehalococcoidia bacterium]